MLHRSFLAAARLNIFVDSLKLTDTTVYPVSIVCLNIEFSLPSLSHAVYLCILIDLKLMCIAFLVLTKRLNGSVTDCNANIVL